MCAAAAYLLRWGGSFCLVHKPERMADVLCALRASSLEAKRRGWYPAGPAWRPRWCWQRAGRGGRPGLQVEPPLILETPEGMPTKEADAIYFRKQEDTP